MEPSYKTLIILIFDSTLPLKINKQKINNKNKRGKQKKISNQKNTTMPENKRYKKKKLDYFVSLILDHIPASKITLSLSLEN